MAPPALPPSRILKALVVYRNFWCPELIRTVHVYRYDDGDEENEEREFVFHQEKNYEESFMGRIFTAQNFKLAQQFEGRKNGVWECIFVFDIEKNPYPDLDAIPSILSVTRNPKLANIPTLADDLEMIFQLGQAFDNGEPVHSPTAEASDEEIYITSSQEASDGEDDLAPQHLLRLDLNSLPPSDSDDEEINLNGPGSLEKKKKRAAPKDLARLALKDIAMYFDVPIVEASKNLNVGLTVLKKKCREFGIPRWPHRKIKSLDSLISNLQDEVKRQQMEDKGAALAMAERQKMIEIEREVIERKPFMEIKMETKKVRQEIFKRKHRARALESQC